MHFNLKKVHKKLENEGNIKKEEPMIRYDKSKNIRKQRRDVQKLVEIGPKFVKISKNW